MKHLNKAGVLDLHYTQWQVPRLSEGAWVSIIYIKCIQVHQMHQKPDDLADISFAGSHYHLIIVVLGFLFGLVFK